MNNDFKYYENLSYIDKIQYEKTVLEEYFSRIIMGYNTSNFISNYSFIKFYV